MRRIGDLGVGVAFVVEEKEELILENGAAERTAIGVLVLTWLNLGSGGRVGSLEVAPGVEHGVADEVEDAAVILVSTGFDGVVGDASSAKGCGSATGLNGELIDRIDRDGVGYGNATALRGDVGYGHAVDVVFVEAGCAGSTIDSRGAACGVGGVTFRVNTVIGRIFLNSGHQVLEGCWIARVSVHRKGKLGIELIFNGSAQCCVGGIQRWRGVGDGDRGILAADGKLDIQAIHRGVINIDVLLQNSLKAFGYDFDIVGADSQRGDGIVSTRSAGLSRRYPGFGIGGGDLCQFDRGPAGVGDGTCNTATGGTLGHERQAAKERQADNGHQADGERGEAFCEKTA